MWKSRLGSIRTSISNTTTIKEQSTTISSKSTTHLKTWATMEITRTWWICQIETTLSGDLSVAFNNLWMTEMGNKTTIWSLNSAIRMILWTISSLIRKGRRKIWKDKKFFIKLPKAPKYSNLLEVWLPMNKGLKWGSWARMWVNNWSLEILLSLLSMTFHSSYKCSKNQACTE